MRIRFVLLGLPFLLSGCAGLHFSGTDNKEAQGFATYLSANTAAEDQDLGRAAHYFRESLNNDPGNSELLSGSFFYSAAAGDIGTAASLAAKVTPDAQDYAVSRLLLAVQAIKDKDYGRARKALAQSSGNPFTLIVTLVDAWAAAGMGDSAAADADVVRLASQPGMENLIAYHKALLAEYERKPIEAEAAYRKALAGSDSSPRIVDAYGRFLERNGRTVDAKALYSQYLQNNAVTPLASAGLARIAAGTKPEPMVATPQQGAAEVLFGIAAALSETSNADASILYLRLTLYLRPDLALGDLLLADRFETLHKYKDAIATYRRIEKSSPFYRVAAVQAAIDETRDQELDQAIADLQVLTVSDPKDIESWTVLGDAYRTAQKYDDAVAAYDHAIAALGTPERKDWALYYARATAQDSLHHWDAAEADLNTALKLSPDEPEVLNFLGYSWVDQGRKIPEALAMLEKARSLRPFDGYITDSVGWAYYRLGRYGDAARTLEQAVLLVPADPTINDHFGDALWRNGQHIDARFQWDHALTFGAQADEKKALEQKLKTGLSDDKPG